MSALIGIYLVVSVGGSVLVDYLVPGYHQFHAKIRSVDSNSVTVTTYDQGSDSVRVDDEKTFQSANIGLEEGQCYRLRAKGKMIYDQMFEYMGYRPDQVVTDTLSHETCPDILN